MRKAAIAAAPVVAIPVSVLALSGRQESRAFSIGVTSNGAVARLGPGSRLCQRAIDVPSTGAFRALRIIVGTSFRPGPELGIPALVSGEGS